MENQATYQTLDDRGRELIAGAALLFMRLGIKAVNMDDLAQQLAVSKKTLYKYVKDKRELVHLALDWITTEQARMMELLVDYPGTAIDADFEMMRQTRAMLKDLHPSVLFDLEKFYPRAFAAMTEHRDRVIQSAVQRNLLRGQQEGVYRSDIHPGVVAQFFVALAHLTSQPRQLEAAGCPIAEFHIQSFQYHIRGIASEQGLAQLEAKLRDESLHEA